jgi:hypothetical protein
VRSAHRCRGSNGDQDQGAPLQGPNGDQDVPAIEGGRATLGATRMNDCPVLRTCLENRPEHVRGHGLI